MIEVMGWIAAAAMVSTYAVEDRAVWWTAAFASACALAALYAVLTAAWPFAALEAVWAGVAVWRYRRRRDAASALT